MSFNKITHDLTIISPSSSFSNFSFNSLIRDCNLPEPCSEQQALEELKEIAEHNIVKRTLIGQGYYGTIIPPVIQRNVFENPAWYTSYTPYQAEISHCLLYTSPSPRDRTRSRMPSSA